MSRKCTTNQLGRIYVFYTTERAFEYQRMTLVRNGKVICNVKVDENFVLILGTIVSEDITVVGKQKRTEGKLWLSLTN